MPSRIQLRRTKGWKKPEGVVSVSRPTRWGNPYSVHELGRDEAIRRFRALFDPGAKTDYTVSEVSSLCGKDLACWCKAGEACHADVLIEMANK
jgi:hypothetical protein